MQRSFEFVMDIMQSHEAVALAYFSRETLHGKLFSTLVSVLACHVHRGTLLVVEGRLLESSDDELTGSKEAGG